MGAPGAGVTTLGRALALRLGYPAFDTDDYYWFTEDALPFKRKRNPDHRRKLMTEDFDQYPQWVLSGSMCGWGDVFIPRFDLVVFLWQPAEVRLQRIKDREILRYGLDRVSEGGDLHTVFEKFMLWAAAYDGPSENIRSRDQELIWLQNLPCATMLVEEQLSVEAIVDRVVGEL